MKRTNSIIGDALSRAEAFIQGFEGDELQEGIGELLDALRVADAAAKSALEALKTIAEQTAPFKDDGVITFVRLVAESAIAKAEGRADA